MNTNERPEADLALNQVLRQWRVETPLPPRFQEAVWRRIERAESQPEPSFWAVSAALAGTFLARPRFAAAYLTLLLVVGVAGGAWAAQMKSSRLDSALSQRYVQAIDPYLGAGAHR